MIEIQGVKLSDEAIEELKDLANPDDCAAELYCRAINRLSDMFICQSFPSGSDVMPVLMMLSDLRRSISILGNIPH